MGAAIINVGNGSTDSTGKIWTFPLSGGTAPYSVSNTNGLLLQTTTNGSAFYAIASAAVSGANLVLTTATPLSSDDTAKLTVQTSATISDSASNTPAGNSNLSITNNSAVTASRYAYNNSAIQYYGRFSYSGNGQGYVNNTNSQVVFVFNGTDCTAVANYDAGNWKVSVDGGAFAAISPNSPYGDTGFLALASGLTAQDHTIVLINTANGAYLNATNTIQVFGGAGTIRAPGASDGSGYGPYVQIESGENYVNGGSWLVQSSGNLISPYNVWNGNTGEWSCCGAPVRAQCSSLYAWVYQNNEPLSLAIDGVVQSSLVTVPNTGSWGFVQLASGLDDTAQHVYTLATPLQAEAQYADAFMVVGSGAAFSPTPLATLPGLGGYGDSITAGAGFTDANAGCFLSLLANALGMACFNRGYGGSTVYGTGSAGEARTTDITSISPEPKFCVVLYGTNDLTSSGNDSTPTSNFGTAYQTMLTDLLNGTGNCMFYVLGILPRTGYDSTTLAAWNGSGNGVQGSIAAVQAASNQGWRLKYVDPVAIGLNGASGTDYTTNYFDGLHPNAAGSVLIADYLQPFLATLTTAGSGSTATTLTITSDGSTPVQNALCFVTADSAGQDPVTGVLVSNASGNVTFNLNPGTGYFLTAMKQGSPERLLDAAAFTA